jgi:putative transposase
MITVASAPTDLSIRQQCRTLAVNRAWYYQRPQVPDRAVRDADLRDVIEAIVLEFPGYGYRRVTHALAREGWSVNHKRVLRVMREESLLCQLQRRFVVTTDSRHAWQHYPNLLRTTVVTAPNQAWVADLMYIRLLTTFVYLAAILDTFSRRCVGWHLAQTLDTSVTLTALERALQCRQPPPGLLHHSDHGVQYASAAYVGRLTAASARVSMAAVGNPYENAQAESFFKTLKREEVWLTEYRTFAEAETHLGRFIEEVYNQKRLHSSLGYVPPAEFEAAHAQRGVPSL